MKVDKNAPKKIYEEKVISIGRVTKVTKGGRTFRFSATVAVGDRKGKVGLGNGKANEVPEAISKAIKAAEKNVFKVELVDDRTISHEVIGECGAARVLIKPAKAGSGIIAGGPVRDVLDLVGVKDVVSKSLGSNTQINTAKATINALKSQRSIEHIAALRGKTVEEIRG
ncbi:MAG: 30S ribosomal protein S5 [Bacilli bacterium]|nr:30S ribosomal protein S5 [Bacilli bacterium]